MSTKSTIILTDDYNEHWFEDCSEHLDAKNNAITLEFSKENVRIDCDDEDSLVITITNPNCEIYNIIKKIKRE